MNELQTEVIKALSFKAECDAKIAYIDGAASKIIRVSQVLDFIKGLQSKLSEYERKLEDGELVSKEWHDEQVGHAELVIEEQKAEIERLTEENEAYKEVKHIDIINELSKENAELQKQVDERENEIDRLEKVVHDQAEQYWDCKEQAVKDTAKEILQELYEYPHEYHERKILEIAKRKGVEVE